MKFGSADDFEAIEKFDETAKEVKRLAERTKMNPIRRKCFMLE